MGRQGETERQRARGAGELRSWGDKGTRGHGESDKRRIGETASRGTGESGDRRRGRTIRLRRRRRAVGRFVALGGAEGAGALAGALTEDAAEVVGVVEADLGGDRVNGKVGGRQ